MGDYMSGYGHMFWGMGWGGIAGIVICVAVVVTLARYLFLNSGR